MRGAADIPRLAALRGDGNWQPLGRHGPDGPGGWAFHQANLDDGPTVTIACVATGIRLGAYTVPLPRGPALRTTVDLARLAAEAAGMPLAPDAVDALRQALARSWIEPDGAARLWADQLLGPLLEGPPGQALGEAAGTVLWVWLGSRPVGAAGIADQVVITDDAAALLRAAAEEARSTGAAHIGPGHLLVALAMQEHTQSARFLLDAGFDAARLRQLFRAGGAL